MRSRLLPGVLVLFCLIPLTAGAASADYMTPDLRARVEKLKADAGFLPTDSVNLPQRADILWQWANAYAMTGGVLPVNLTQTVAMVTSYPELASTLTTMVDDFVFEMTLLDEHPDAIGTLVADTGPFEARKFVTISQTYTVGSREIQTGGGFLVARHFMPNYGVWQTSDPKADNYLSITTSNRRVSFATDAVQVRGMHGGFRGAAPALVFRVATGTLVPGDTVTITYGDTSQGSRGFLMADFSSDRMPLPLYLAFHQDEPFLTLPIQPIRVTGTTIAGVHGFAPSIVAPEEPFTLTVRAQDAYYNRARDGHPPFRVLDGDRQLVRVNRSEDPISQVEIALTGEGAHYLTIVSDDGSIRGEVNPILVTAAPQNRIFWGDTHGHSGFAEGIGTPDRFMTWARDDARLDYVVHSEHDIWMDDLEWEVLRENVASYTREGEFIAYLGYEWTVRNFQGGHHNVLFRTAEGRDRIPAQFYPTLSRLYQGLRATADTEDVLIIPHAHQAGDYRLNDPELEPLIEIMSQHGNFEWFGRMYLQHGHQVGFVAASDNHLSQPGYSAPKNASLAQRGGLGAIMAREKTTDAIFDAMKSLKAYATTGDRIILSMDVNGAGMGERAEFATARTIRGRVIGTAPVDSISIIRNGETLWEQDYLTDTEDRLEAEERVLLSFASDATPFHPGDNPRGWRHWRGTLTVENATVEGVRGMDFHNQLVQSLERDEDNPNVLRFATITRGDTSSIELALSGVKRTTSIRVELEAARETGGGPPIYRRPQEMPAASTTLNFRDMTDGRVEQIVDGGDYQDTVVLRKIITDGPREVSFEVEDEGNRQGDYYFVRVRQANDAMAWSSPVWVGGYPKR